MRRTTKRDWPRPGAARNLTLDQLRVLLAVVDAGSFSGAAKTLHRTQPVISYAIANLEAELGVILFDRNRRSPTLTEAGGAIVADARRISLLVDELAARAAPGGELETSISLVVDVLFPPQRLAATLARFADAFPSVAVELKVAPLEGVAELVLAGAGQIGISLSQLNWGQELERYDCGTGLVWPVAAPHHPLALCPSPITISSLRGHRQLILRAPPLSAAEINTVISGFRTWVVEDLSIQRELLYAGVGWAHMPEWVVAEDIRAGRLVRLATTNLKQGFAQFVALHRTDARLGIAAAWLLREFSSGQDTQPNCDLGDAIEFPLRSVS